MSHFPGPLGTGQRFRECVRSVTASSKKRGDPLRSAAAVCAAIGRRKYGAQRFAELAAAGRQRRTQTRKTHGSVSKSTLRSGKPAISRRHSKSAKRPRRTFDSWSGAVTRARSRKTEAFERKEEENRVRRILEEQRRRQAESARKEFERAVYRRNVPKGYVRTFF
jgi:hypothetical protein